MHQYKLSDANQRLELTFEDNFTQDDLYMLAKELNECTDNCQIIFDLSSLKGLDSTMLGAILALKHAYSHGSAGIELIGCTNETQQMLQTLNVAKEFIVH